MTFSLTMRSRQLVRRYLNRAGRLRRQTVLARQGPGGRRATAGRLRVNDFKGRGRISKSGGKESQAAIEGNPNRVWVMIHLFFNGLYPSGLRLARRPAFPVAASPRR